jgi:hypothetical protein
VNTENDIVTGNDLLGALIWVRNKPAKGFKEARERDGSHHARLMNAARAFSIWLIQLGNVAAIMIGLLNLAALFVSPFGRWLTVQDALTTNAGIAMHCLYGMVAFVCLAIGISRMRYVGTIGAVGRFLAWEYCRVKRLLRKGHMFQTSIEFLSSLEYQSDVDIMEQWQRYLYTSLVSFSQEIIKDERKYGGSSRGYLERTLINQLKVAMYFGVGNDVRLLRREVFAEANGTRSPRFV